LPSSDHPRRRAPSLYRTDGAFSDRFLVLFDSQFSIISWSLKKLHLISTNIDFLGESVDRALVGDFRQYLARRTVHRDYVTGRIADGIAVPLEAATIDGLPPGSGFASSPIRC